ncbi:CRISPR-associated protein Cas4 [Candidatus Chloroploca sp. Khr17]|uniref:CRISPR-associated protein Cas4 n=1 Tax=Candidatus Chloroploca sp. Khr17 TaxID=2496869 RepID=UPI00101C5F0F|nr:CRISPR-associated protein Cas4 [Candidatus Chloroploca sp. Khr17]
MSIIGPPEHIPLAMLNALAYCPRRFGYEFIQAEMLYNEHVVEGLLRHQGVDLGGTTWLSEAVQERRVYVWSERLSVAGFCDLVEFKDGTLYPVEYKKGRPGRWRNDHIQLCAQAMCLEERTGTKIEKGYIFSFATRRREEVIFTCELRTEVEQLTAEAHRLAALGVLPPPTDKRAKCRDCSLEPLCLPDELRRLADVTGWEGEERG